MKSLLTTLQNFTGSRAARLAVVLFAGFVLAGFITFGLRAVSAGALGHLGGKFGITERSRAGRLIKRIAPGVRWSPVEKAAPFPTLTVTNGNDSGGGSLRDTIAAAASGDTIVFSGVTTVTLTGGELTINKNLTIDGGTNGVTITRSSVTQFRIFTISSGTVSMSKLTITGGNPTTQAGGIQNSGTLTMTDCAITGNTSPQGGGIQNDGALTMTNCTVSGNTSTGSGGGFAMFGTTTSLTNCTVSGNTASSGGGFSISSGTLNLTNCTVTNNSGSGGGGGMNLSGSTHVLKNTIVAGNASASNNNIDIGGTVSSTSSYNLIGGNGTGGLTNGTNGNQVGVASPLLDVLASNGGYTQTHSLMFGSPALDKGAAVSGLTTDQRGQTRPYDISNIAAASGGNNSDIGAFEVNPTCNTVTVNPASLPSGTVGLNYTQSVSATGGSAPYTFAVTSGSLPAGVSLASDGTFSGLPTATGTSNFTVTAHYGFGCSGNRAYSITIAACANTKTYTVNDPGDAADATPGDNICATAGSVCTLRAAIQEINALPGCANNINFSVTGTINMSGAYPDLAASFTFNGPGATQLTVRRNTSGTYRILTIPLGAGATISGLTFSNGLNDEGGAIRNAGTLAISDCAFSGNNSKGTNAGGPTGKTGGGGAVFNDATGTTTVMRSALTGNIATGGNGETFTSNGGGGGGGGLGGAIFNNGGTVTVTNTTLSGNSAVGGAGGNGSTTCPTGPGGKGGGNGADATTAAGFGGGGFGGGNNGSPSVGGRFGGGGGGRANGAQAGVNGGFLGGRGNNSTSSCTSGGGGGGGAAGGAIFNYGGTFTIVNATIVSNSATGGALGSNGGSGTAGSSRAGGIYNETGTLTIKNSILAGNTAQQAGFEDSDSNSNAITTNGYNLFGSGTGNPTGGTQDQTIAPANVFTTALGSLQYFGSATQVHPPLTGSPVIDKGAAHTGITVDQRNKTRPIDQAGIPSAVGGNASDIGAFEKQACSSTISITPTTLTPFGAGSPTTRTLTASGGTSPYVFSLASGTLPAGVTLSSAGVLSGTANSTGAYSFSVQAYDQNDCATTQAYTLDVITCPAVTAQPQSQAVCDGGSITLSVTLSDPTGFSYQWRKGGMDISGATNSTYTIAAFTPADVASYDVVMTSASCQITSSAASLTALGLTTMTNAMPYWAGRLNGAQFEIGTVAASGANTWPATEPPGNAFDGTFAKSLIRNTTNAGYVFTPGSCNPSGRVINQMRIYTANDTVARDPASYAIYGTTSTVSGNGPFALAQFTLISSGSLTLPSGRNISTLDDANSQLVSFANSTAYKSYMLVFPANSGDGVSTQIGEVKFYPENYQPTLNTTAASISQGGTSTGNSIGTAVAGTAQAANTLTTAVSSDGTTFGASATLNGVTISNVAVAANGNVTASLTATCSATNTSFTVRITNNQSQSVTATVNVNVTANTAPGFASTATLNRQAGSPVSNSQIATVSDAEMAAGGLTVTITSANPSSGVTISNIVNTGGTITADIVGACGASNASFTLQVGDGCATATTTLNVTVTANTAPTLTYGNVSVNVGNSTTVNPATGPTDGVSVSSIVVQSVTPSTAPATISVDNTTGVVTVPNNVPGGTYTVTIRATDNCGLTTDAPFTLTVVAPTLGNYPATTMNLSEQATITPDAAPINTTSIQVKASSGFNGTLYANPTTGAVKIVNANPAGTHTITVTAFGLGVSSAKTFTLTVQSGTACPTPPQFSSGTSISGGSGLYTAVGDFNNDGKQDLAITNYSSASISIRLGDGAGGFTGGATVSTNNSPLWVAVGDFNGDGNQDLAVACSSTVSIRLGDGAGNFSGTTNVSTGSSCSSVAVGDFNGDGKLDFVTANAAVDTSSVRLGDGAGGFTGTANVSVGLQPGAVVVGDFDNDGDLDFACSNQISGTVSIRLNNGAGTFSGSTEITVGSDPEYMQLGDFNEDGNLDFVASNRTSGTLSIRFGNGAGGFTGSTNISVSSGPAQVVVADLNNDGNQDLAVKGNGLFNYLLGNGLGGFGSPVSVSVPGATGGYCLVLGDFNQDGRQDLIADNFSTGTYYVQLGGCNTPPTITAGGPLARQAGSSVTSATIATVNDNETAAGSLTVTATTIPNGLTVAGITNTSGTITAIVTAACNATVGPNTVALTVTDGNGATATADLTVNVTAATAPTTANAGPDQTLCATAPATLAANVPSAGSGAWSIISGPSTSTAQFNSLTNPAATFTPAGGTGAYTLRWTITGACATSTDDVVLSYNANPTTANAGPDQTFCGTSAATLAANTPSIGTGAWTVISGPSTLASQFSITSSPTATFTPAGGTGTYTLRWTISNSPCTASTDDVVLTYNAVPTITLGASPSVFPGATSANLPYSTTTGSPNQYSIDYDSTANTAGFADVTNASLPVSPIALAVPGAAAAGTYNATLTVRNSATGCVSSSVAFTVTISNCPSQFTVNDLGDAVDATPGNGVCATAGGVCTLRAAIQEANALTACSPITINFSVTSMITLLSALPALAHPNLTITGPGADLLTISGANAYRVFNITAGDVTLADLTIANGRVSSGLAQGGGINNSSSGIVNIRNCTIADNAAAASGSTNNYGSGGGIYHKGGTLNVSSSTLSGNTASGTGGGAIGTGGGIFVNEQSTGPVNVSNSTIANNTCSASGTSSNIASGGGFYNSAVLNITNCTISGNSVTGNSAFSNGGGIKANAGTVTLGNTIVANNTASTGGPDVNGGISSSGYNLIKNTTGAFISGTTTGNQTGVDPLLAPLGNYGGPARTMSLLPGSPAIDMGAAATDPITNTTITKDQRNITRPQGSAPDIGAFESQGFTLAVSSGNNQSAAAGSAFALPLSVTVTSSNSEPVNGGRLTFTPPGGGATATIAGNPATIASGAATSGTVTASTTSGGPYTVSASAKGATAVSFSLTNTNSAPAFTPASAISRQQGASAGAAVTVGTVADAQTAPGSLTVTQIAGGTATGITVTSITNTGGTITGVVTADCTATSGTVRFQVSDGSATGTGELTVNVTANTAPALTYAAVSVNAGGSTTNSPATATDNGSIASYTVQSQGTYTGTISVNASGVVSISNAAPVGTHTITIQATDNCNLTANATFTLTVGNNAPTITAGAALTRQRGTAGSVSTIATVSDGETPVGSLMVTATTVPAGITVTLITNNTGTVTATVAADCTATIGANTVVLTVTDGNSGTATANLTVNVTANTAPSVTYANVSVNAAGSTTNSPTSATDNGSITGYTVQSQGTYTGTISVNTSGVVSISNAAPVGMHTITIRATDNCNVTTDATFTLTVGNNAPMITAGTALTRQRGSAGTVSTIATVNDGETPVGSLAVTVTTVPAGITVTSIINTAGTITATVAADCTATIGANTVVLTVTDGNGSTATANLTANVTANTAPTLSYGNQTVAAGGALNVNPTAASDNGSITGYTIVSVTPALSTAPTVNSSGVVAITSAAPFGLHTITVRATDNCGLTTEASFTVNVSCPTITLPPGSLSGGTMGTAYDQTLTAGGGASPYAFAVTGGGLPGGLSLSAAGELSGTPNATGSFNFTVTATDANNCTGSQAYSISIACPAITLSALPNGTVGAAYSQTVAATPAGTYSFAVTSGALPPGLSLETSTGAISGTPTGSGSFNFRITATGSGVLSSCSGARDYSIAIACGTVALTPESLPNGVIGEAYNQTLSATPGSGYSFVVTLGSMPVGLTLNAATGAITGTPTVNGSYNFRITATAGACSGTKEYAMEIGCAAITLPALANATAGNAYSQSVAATPSGTYTYSLTQGNLPSGLTLNSQTGLLSGTPSVTGSYSFTIRVQAGNGCSVTRAYSFPVTCPVVTINPASLPNGTLGTAYSQTLSGSPAGGNYTYVVTTGSLPAGLSLNPATGALSGTPTANGTFSFTITATGFSCTGSKVYTLTVGGGSCPTITLPVLPNGAPAQLYNSSVAASPSGSYSYAVSSGSLPPGLTLYASFGLIHGYPTTAGAYNFTITATSANNCTGSRNYALSIGGSATASLVFGDFDGDGKADLSVWRGQAGDWLTVNSGDGNLRTEAWGTAAAPYFDVMTPGDYDGDGKMDLAVFRRSTGQWLIKGSQDGAITSKVWGLGTDTPVAADYDGDGKTDIAVWRGTDTNWYILRSSDQQTETASWGTSDAPYSDLAVPADYDGDGRTDIAVFRQQNGHWYIRLSSDESVLDKVWGLGTDVPVAADYDGDGKADIAVWRGAETNWYVLRSSDGQTQAVSWGTSSLGDVPVPGDYDGDLKADVGVWRASQGVWFVKCSRDGSVKTMANGQAGDTPVTAKQR